MGRISIILITLVSAGCAGVYAQGKSDDNLPTTQHHLVFDSDTVRNNLWGAILPHYFCFGRIFKFAGSVNRLSVRSLLISTESEKTS